MTWGLDQTLLTCLGLLGVAGAWLLKRGVWPRRSGDTPHCAHCGYTLVGVDPAVCPECGTDLKEPAAVLRGERHRKPTIGWTGLILTLAALGCGIAWVVRASADLAWYQIRPFTWVLRDLSGPPELAKQAIDEIERRWVMDELKPAQFNQLFERLLKERASSTAPSNSQFPAMMNLLAKGYQRGKLSNAQQQRFLETALAMKLVVIPGDFGQPPFVRVVCDGIGPGRDTYIPRATVLKSLSWDGKPVVSPPMMYLHGALGTRLSNEFSTRHLREGTHTIQTHWLTTVDGTNDIPPFRREETYEATFVVPAPPPPVEWQTVVPTPIVKPSIAPGEFTATPIYNGDFMNIRGTLTIKNAPVNFAFEASVSDGGRVLALGGLRVPAGKSGDVTLSGEIYPMDRPFDVTLSLKRSEFVAFAGSPPFKSAYGKTLLYRIHVNVSPPSMPAAK